MGFQKKTSREILYTPPPLHPILATRHFSGRALGGIYFEALRRQESGVGGDVQNLAPPKMHFPTEECSFVFRAEKCTFLQKNVAFGGHMAGNHRKSQEGFRAQESRTLANFHKKIHAQSLVPGGQHTYTYMKMRAPSI